MSEGTQPFTFKALIKVTRFWNLVILGMAQFFTACFLIGFYTILDWHLYILAISTVLIAAGGYIINDYYDVKIDLINKPDRVVVGKSMRRRYALFFHTSLSVLGVALGLLLSWKIAGLNFFSAFLLWLYSNLLKRRPFVGNFSIALLTGLSVYAVAMLFEPANKLIIVYSFFSFFITLVREIIKDMEDLKGDNTFGCQTLPILWGMRQTKTFIYLLIAIHIIVIIYFSNIYIHLPLWMPVLFIFLPLAFLIWRLALADTIKDFYRLSFYCKLILVFGIFSMMLV